MEIEIKFRGRDNQGVWHYGDLMHTKHFAYILNTKFLPAVSIPAHQFKEVKPHTVGQFTGINDKAGNEIYSGSKINCFEYDPNEGRVIQEFKNAVVGFEKGSYYYYPDGNMKQPHQLLMYAYDVEIVDPR